MTNRTPHRVFVAGATGFLGYRVVRALLDEGADVTALVRPDAEEKLGSLRNRVRLVTGDVWNAGSLRGRARGHAVVIHLIGGIKPDPSRGLTFRHLNFVSARNVAQMAVNDGVPHYILLSAAGGFSGAYIESKREAERYLQKTGLVWTIIRAPALFAPGSGRGAIGLLLAALSRIPLLGLPFGRYSAMPVDTAARGIASLALSADETRNRLISPRQLRRAGWLAERKFVTSRATDAEELLLDEPPFGWLPPPPQPSDD